MARASYQNPANISLGRRNLIATGIEERQLNKAIGYLREAKKATDEDAFVLHTSEAFKLIRNITRSRIL